MKLPDSMQEVGTAAKCLITLTVVLAAFLIGGIFIAILRVDPLEAYYYLLVRPFRSFRSIGEISVKLMPALIVGLGVSFTFQAKLSNLGEEGQICLGAIGMTIVGISPLAKNLGPVWLPLGILTAVVLGVLWAGIAGFFETQSGVSEIIATLLLNHIAVQFLSYCVYYPLRDPKGNIPQSAKVVSTLSKLFEGSCMNAGILIALAGSVIYWIVIKKTSFGYRLRTLGGSIKAVTFGGISQKKYHLSTMLVSGTFAGVVGAIEIADTQTRLLEGLTGPYGLDGVVAALLGMLHPVGALVSSILLAALSSGVETMQVKTGVSSLSLNVFQALIVPFILLGFSFFGVAGKKEQSDRRIGEVKK